MIERHLSPCHLAHIVFALAQREKAGDDIGVVYFAYKFGDIPGMYAFKFDICNFDQHFFKYLLCQHVCKQYVLYITF
jgi:hypothetical protein